MKLRQLEMKLQKLKGFENPEPSLEQYVTSAPLAARLLFHAALNGDVSGAHVLDLGCGTGMLAVGAALLGGEVTGVDCDPNALLIAEKNAEEFGVQINFLQKNIDGTNLELFADTVIMNPPFGAQKKHADRPFIDAALIAAPEVYGIFNADSIPFITSYVKGRAEISEKISARLVIQRQFFFHTKDQLEVPVEIVHLRRLDHE